MLFWLSKTKRLEIYFSMLYLFLVLTLNKILTVHKKQTNYYQLKLTQQYKPSLTAIISCSNWICVAKWHVVCEGYTYALHLSGVWHVRAIRTHAT